MTLPLHDSELLKDLNLGKQQAINHIFNKYWEDLYIHALKITQDEHAANEIVQKLFINLWAKRLKLHIQSLSQYLYKAVRNGCIDYMRSELSRIREWDHYSSSIPTTIDSPEVEYLRAEVYERLQLMLDLLPKKSKEIFEKNKMQGLTANQIAQSLNLSKRSVEYHLAMVKKHLKKGFSEFLLVVFFSRWIFHDLVNFFS